MTLRNIFCGSLGLALIALGRVRRAKKRVLESDVVTAIYFHNPNKRLFAQCIQWLTKRGYTFISCDQLIEILRYGMTPPKQAVWLSFDDGFKEILDTVVPLICQEQVPITIFVPPGIVEGDGLFRWLHQTEQLNAVGANTSARNGKRDSITVADLKEIAKCPQISFGSHTVGHTVTVNLSEERARYEFAESRRALEFWTGAAITTFAYPEGRFDGRESLLLGENGYELAATTQTGFITQATDPYLVPRFHVGDDFTLPEAICNMVGVWRPVIDPIIKILDHCANFYQRLPHGLRNQWRSRRTSSA